MDFHPSLRLRARVPGEVRLGLAAEIERDSPDSQTGRPQQLEARAEQVRCVCIAEPAADELAQPARTRSPHRLYQALQRTEDHVGHGRRRHRRVAFGV